MRGSLRGSGEPLPGTSEPLAIGLDAGMAKDEGAHPRPGRLSLHGSRPAGRRCEGTKLLEVHHIYDGDADVLLVPDEELATVCRKHNPRGG